MKWRTRAAASAYGQITAQKKLTDSYRDVFGKQSEAVEMVLADLAAHTGFYQVEPPGDMSAYQAGYRNGLRAAFGRLFHFLSLSDQQMAALEEAARLEASNPYNEE